MSARTVIEHALRVYYADSRDPAAAVDKLLAQYDGELLAAHGIVGEKGTRGGSPQQGESTHRHARPCEFPEVLCSCPRPRGLSDASINRARHLARVAEFFRSAGAARTRTWSAAS